MLNLAGRSQPRLAVFPGTKESSETALNVWSKGRSRGPFARLALSTSRDYDVHPSFDLGRRPGPWNCGDNAAKRGLGDIT
jgi:hypothetical protein